MTFRIVYARPDGGVGVCEPAVRDRRPKETNDQWLARIIVSDVPPDASDVHIVTVDQLPARTFRNAWSLNNGRVGVDMAAAREVRRNSLREARKPLLQAADAEMTRALSDPARQAEIAVLRQALRDAPAHPDIEAAQTPGELAAVWPLPTDNPTPKVLDIPPPLPSAEPTGWSLKQLLRRASAEPDPEPEPKPDPELEPMLSELAPAPLPDGPELPALEPVPPEVGGLADSERRKAARALIAAAVAQASRNTTDNQVRYELALQAKNGQVRAMSLFEPEAATLAITIAALADRIVGERHARERRMMQVYAIQARVLGELDRATGDDIDATAASAALEINQGK